MFRCFFDTIDSTNTEAKRVINCNSSLPDIFSIIANNQTQGRGKLGAVWKTHTGNLNLSVSLNLKKYLDDMKNIGLMSILSSIAVRETLSHFIFKEDALKKQINQSSESKNYQNLQNLMQNSHKVVSKWPNDILIKTQNETSKISGILLEIEQNLNNESYLIIGIGVNLAWSPNVDKYSTISLSDIISKQINVLDFSENLENNIIKLLKELQSNKENIVNKFKENLFLFNEYIQIKVGDTLKSGVFYDITQEGYLILKDDNNKKITVTAGEIFGF